MLPLLTLSPKTLPRTSNSPPDRLMTAIPSATCGALLMAKPLPTSASFVFQTTLPLPASSATTTLSRRPTMTLPSATATPLLLRPQHTIICSMGGMSSVLVGLYSQIFLPVAASSANTSEWQEDLGKIGRAHV